MDKATASKLAQDGVLHILGKLISADVTTQKSKKDGSSWDEATCTVLAGKTVYTVYASGDAGELHQRAKSWSDMADVAVLVEEHRFPRGANNYPVKGAPAVTYGRIEVIDGK